MGKRQDIGSGGFGTVGGTDCSGAGCGNVGGGGAGCSGAGGGVEDGSEGGDGGGEERSAVIFRETIPSPSRKVSGSASSLAASCEQVEWRTAPCFLARHPEHVGP